MSITHSGAAETAVGPGEEHSGNYINKVFIKNYSSKHTASYKCLDEKTGKILKEDTLDRDRGGYITLDDPSVERVTVKNTSAEATIGVDFQS